MKDFLDKLLPVIKLPEGMTLYKVDGQCVFPIRGADGSLTPSFISYLIGINNDGKYCKFGIMFTNDMNESKALNEFLLAIEVFKAQLKEDAVLPENNLYNPEAS